ncbi:MAG: helix-turn-helix transcriptional regulator [Clostridia bacterium]|nr:helix-turn-helix transcriptional regulator [Clostridia bacterium]
MYNTLKVEIFKNYMNENNLSKTRFCKLCGISPKTFAKIMTGDAEFHIIALYKMARVINIPIYKMFNQ